MYITATRPGQMVLLSGLAGDRTAAASYCGQKYGVTSPDFQPCVNWYANDKTGDYPGTTPAPTPTPTPVPPGTVPPIVTPTMPSASMWAAIPTWLKVLGAVAIGFIGYKLLVPSKKTA